MREADVVKRLRQTFKDQIPTAVFLKYHDVSTFGIPDVTVTFGGATTFIEVKLLKAHETRSTFRAHIEPLQLATCRLLERQGACHYLVAFSRGKKTWAAIMKPSRVAILRDSTDVFNGGEDLSPWAESVELLDAACLSLVRLVVDRGLMMRKL